VLLGESVVGQRFLDRGWHKPHEIKQPLTVISAGSSAAMRWLKRTPPDCEEAIACLTVMSEASGRVDEVLNSTRELVKITAQPKTMIEINRLVLQVLRMAENDLHVQGVSVSTEFQEDLPQIMGDRTLLQQVILNLVKNAVDAMGTQFAATAAPWGAT
jgi:signal transduction histidine kinase